MDDLDDYYNQLLLSEDPVQGCSEAAELIMTMQTDNTETTTDTKKKKKTKVYELKNMCDNLLYKEKRELCGVVNMNETTYLSSITTATTISLNGCIEGLTFNQETLIKYLKPTGNILGIKCNFGKISIDGYKIPIDERKEEKKKQKQKTKPRKIQGSGECFNSQITFYMLKSYDKYTKQYTVYKPKLFQNGEIQLPGAQPNDLDKIVDAFNEISACVNKGMYLMNNNREYDEKNINDIAINEFRLTKLVAVMKNYKCKIKLDQQTQMINLKELHNKLISWKDEHPELQDYPDIQHDESKYTVEDVKLTTVMTVDNDVDVKIKIYPSGKVNIQGYCNEIFIKKIHNMIAIILENNHENIIIRKQVTDDIFDDYTYDFIKLKTDTQ